MLIDAGRENSERPTRSETDLRPPKWLTRIVEAVVPPELGSPNELIDVLLETHGSIAQAVLHIPAAIAPPALGRARDAFYWRMAMAQTAILFLRSLPAAQSDRDPAVLRPFDRWLSPLPTVR